MKFEPFDVKEKFEAQKIQIDELNEMVKRLDQAIWNQGVLRRNLVSEVEEIKEKISEKSAPTHVMNRIGEIEGKVKKLEGHYYSDGDLSAIHGSIRNIEKNMEYDQHQVKRLEDRIDACEQNYPSLWKRIKTIEDFIGQNYKNDIDVIKTTLADNIRHVNERINEMRGLALHPTKPHKCPVCNSLGFISTSYIGNGANSEISRNVCHGCEGKGMVWG